MGLFLVTTPYQPNGISLTVPSLCFPSPSYSDLDRIWCSAVHYTSYIPLYSCCYQGTQTLAPGWLGWWWWFQKGNQRTDGVFLLSSRITYCIPLPWLRDKERKRRPSLRDILRLPVAKVMDEAHPWPKGSHLAESGNHVPVHRGSWCLVSLFFPSY